MAPCGETSPRSSCGARDPMAVGATRHGDERECAQMIEEGVVDLMHTKVVAERDGVASKEEEKRQCVRVDGEVGVPVML